VLARRVELQCRDAVLRAPPTPTPASEMGAPPSPGASRGSALCASARAQRSHEACVIIARADPASVTDETIVKSEHSSRGATDLVQAREHAARRPVGGVAALRLVVPHHHRARCASLRRPPLPRRDLDATPAARSAQAIDSLGGIYIYIGCLQEESTKRTARSGARRAEAPGARAWPEATRGSFGCRHSATTSSSCSVKKRCFADARERARTRREQQAGAAAGPACAERGGGGAVT
jgi:hypothetical protein